MQTTPSTKIKQPFMLKTLNKLGINRTYLKIIKAIYDKATANIAKAGSIPFEHWHKRRMPSLTTPTQHCIGSSGQGNQARRNNKRTQIGREEVKLSLFAGDMILLYI